MKISKIHLFRVQIPFKQKFRHAAAERASTDNIVVETMLADGTLGYGEGLPRDYVTGETPETVTQSLKNLESKIFEVDIQNIGDLMSYLESELVAENNLGEGKGKNTARCALELSLLDAFSRVFRKNLSETVLSENIANTPRPEVVYYDGVISLGSLGKSFWKACKLKLYGFRRIKIKLGVDDELNLKNLRMLRRIFGQNVDLRVDVNGAWSLEAALRLLEPLNRFRINSIEQPLPHTAIMQMCELRGKSPIPLMLDESLCDMDDARTALKYGLCDLFNIRLSKCGGWVSSLKIARLARSQGLGFQLGCMVGETGILSAAGRHFAFVNPDIKYLEGSYDRFLLKDNVTRQNVGFGWGGKARPLSGFGIGVEVDAAKLKLYSVDKVELYG